LSEDALLQIITHEGVLDYIKSHKEPLLEMFCALLHAYQKMHPNEPCTLKILGPLIWDILKWEIKVRNVFVLHQFDMDGLENYGGPISVFIVEQVLKIIEVDFETIKLKKTLP
jgi:hypothetical protein